MSNADARSNETTRLIPPRATQYNHCLDPRRKILKFIVLNLLGFLSSALDYGGIVDGLLQDRKQNIFHISSSTANLADALFAWSTVLSPIIGGIFMDKWLDVAPSAIVFCALTLFGQFVLTLSAYLRCFWLMLVGRALFSIGVESLLVVQSVYTREWFFGKGLQLAFGVQIFHARFFGTLRAHAITSMAGSSMDSSTIAWGCLLYTLAGVIPFISALLLRALDSRRQRIRREDAPINAPSQFHWRDLRKLPALLICVLVIWLFYITAAASLERPTLLFYIEKYGLSYRWAKLCGALTFFLPCILSIILGHTIDRVGRDLFWLLSGLLIAMIAHALLAFSFAHPLVSSVLLGISYSVVATTVPALTAFLVPRKMLGTADGLMQSIWNLSYVFAYMYLDLVVRSYGVFSLEIVFIVCTQIALSAAGLLYVVNYIRNGILNDSPHTRVVKQVALENRAHSAADASENNIE